MVLIVRIAETILLVFVSFFFQSFNVDLLSGKTKDIALHLNPRLNVKAFVRNSFLQGAWGEEERNITCFPFSPGMYFEVRFYFLKMGQEKESWEGCINDSCKSQSCCGDCVWCYFEILF